MLKKLLAVAIGKSVLSLLRFLNRSATAFPGKLALRILPDLIQCLLDSSNLKTVYISGTNGKSTTSSMIKSILQTSKMTVVCNDSGANLLTGIATSLLESSSWLGRLAADVVVLEVDEATLPKMILHFDPDIIIITNFFADQLDRFGEVEKTVHIVHRALKMSCAKICLNADDPYSAGLASELSSANDQIFYGIEPIPQGAELECECAERHYCALCGESLIYRYRTYAHIGKYECPQCSFSRPSPDACARVLNIGTDHSGIEFSFSDKLPQCLQDTDLLTQIRLPGVYNIYNAVASASAAALLEVAPDFIDRGLSEFEGVFGRWEKFYIEGVQLEITLVKNPVGLNQVMRSVQRREGAKVMFLALNDKAADGRDISWIWDVNFEETTLIECSDVHFVVAGTRADDLAVRLKYAGLDEHRLTVESDLVKALDACCRKSQQEDAVIYSLPNYSAMWKLRREILRRVEIEEAAGV